MNEKTKEYYQTIKKTVESEKVLKTVVYIGVGIIGLYLLSKAFHTLAVTVRAYNNLKSAINGN